MLVIGQMTFKHDLNCH